MSGKGANEGSSFLIRIPYVLLNMNRFSIINLHQNFAKPCMVSCLKMNASHIYMLRTFVGTELFVGLVDGICCFLFLFKGFS